MFSDVALYAGLWFECESEMYQSIEGLGAYGGVI